MNSTTKGRGKVIFFSHWELEERAKHRTMAAQRRERAMRVEKGEKKTLTTGSSDGENESSNHLALKANFMSYYNQEDLNPEF